MTEVMTEDAVVDTQFLREVPISHDAAIQAEGVVFMQSSADDLGQSVTLRIGTAGVLDSVVTR